MEINYDYKDEIIENLKEALHGTVRAKGRRYFGNRRYEINESSILTKLIQEAGRWCELATVGEIYEFREGEIEIMEVDD